MHHTGALDTNPNSKHTNQKASQPPSKAMVIRWNRKLLTVVLENVASCQGNNPSVSGVTDPKAQETDHGSPGMRAKVDIHEQWDTNTQTSQTRSPFKTMFSRKLCTKAGGAGSAQLESYPPGLSRRAKTPRSSLTTKGFEAGLRLNN